MDFRLTPEFGIQLKIDGNWLELTNEHAELLSEEDKKKLEALATLSDLFKRSIPKDFISTENEWGNQMYNGILSVAQALVGVTGVAIATPFALIAGAVGEASGLLIETLESAKIK